VASVYHQKNVGHEMRSATSLREVNPWYGLAQSKDRHLIINFMCLKTLSSSKYKVFYYILSQSKIWREFFAILDNSGKDIILNIPFLFSEAPFQERK
jgi:hypothetical protein